MLLFFFFYKFSACNKTYYGEVGNSYRLTVKKQHKESPFLCHLSFTAIGQEHGDFVQVSIYYTHNINYLINKKKYFTRYFNYSFVKLIIIVWKI